MGMGKRMLLMTGSIWILFILLAYSSHASFGHFALLSLLAFSMVYVSTLYFLKKEIKTPEKIETNVIPTFISESAPPIEQKRKFIIDHSAYSKEFLGKLAKYDTLTSLPNRIFFNEILNKTLSHAKRNKKILSILFIDFMNFDTALAEYDKSISDQVIKEIGNRLVKSLRSEDIIAKLEGEEFIILLNDIAKNKYASTVAEKILKACTLPIKVEGDDFIIKPKIGISMFPTDGNSLEDLLKNADIALQRAKHSRNKSYEFYTSSMNIEANEYIQLEAALRKALQTDQLTLHYQPKLNLKKGSVVSVEALIRWNHPELGEITPAKFIPLAEETGLIMLLGEWALREACKTNKFWQKEGYEHITVSVNLSPKQFYHDHLVDLLKHILRDTGLDPSYLELEINESSIMQDINAAQKKLEAIKGLGVEIAFDHFGVGYTSISHLRTMPISTIKIDRNFINGIPIKTNDIAITNAMIAMGHNLGLNVIAEGVETAEQVEHLAAMDCDIVQGYFISHPLPGDKVVLQFKKLMDAALI